MAPPLSFFCKLKKNCFGWWSDDLSIMSKLHYLHQLPHIWESQQGKKKAEWCRPICLNKDYPSSFWEKNDCIQHQLISELFLNGYAMLRHAPAWSWNPLLDNEALYIGPLLRSLDRNERTKGGKQMVSWSLSHSHFAKYSAVHSGSKSWSH